MERFVFLCVLLSLTNAHPQNAQNINPDRIIFKDPDVQIARQNIKQVNELRLEPSKVILPPSGGSGLLTRSEQTDQSELDRFLTIRLDGNTVALTNFSLNLMKEINHQKSGNTVVSPFSIATLLSLLQQGATGTALEQISKALQMNQISSLAAFKSHIVDIQSRSSRNTLRTANNVFLANGFTVNLKYRTLAQRDYRCDVTPTNFASSAQAAKDINNWIAMMTNNMIKNLISPDSLGINTQMVLVNAMYFKGFWEIPFNKQATKPGPFRAANGMKMVQYMQIRKYFRTSHDQYTDSRVIVLPFEREEYSLMIIMPSTLTNVRDALSTLTVAQLEKFINSNPLEVQLEIPKFSIRADTDLTTILKAMGISKIFEETSDLTNIGTYQNISPQVSAAVHSAVLSIDEEGGSAAAATAFSVVALSNTGPAINFKVNRPFIAVLWDGKAKVPLFIAKIEDP